MPLQRQEREFPLFAGQDTKSDAKAVVPSKLQFARNVRLNNTGSLRKRHPYKLLDSGTRLGLASGQTGAKIWSFGKSGIASYERELYSYSDSGDTVADKSAHADTTEAAAIVDLESAPFSSAYAPSVADYARTGNYELIVSGNPTSAQYIAQWRDAVTGAVLFTSDLALSAGGEAKAIAVADTLMVVYTNGSGQVRTTYLDTTDLGSGLTTTVAAADVNATSESLDVCTDGTYVYVAYTDTTPEIALRKVSAAGASAGVATLTGNADSGAISAVLAENGTIFVSWCNTTNGVEAGAFSTTPTAGSQSVVDAAATDCASLTSGYGSGSTKHRVYYETADATSTSLKNVTWREGSADGSGGWSSATDLEGFVLATKALDISGHDSTYIVLGRDSLTTLGEDKIFALTRFGRSDTGDFECEPVGWVHSTSADPRQDQNIRSGWGTDGTTYWWAGIARRNLRLISTATFPTFDTYAWDSVGVVCGFSFARGNAVECQDILAIAGGRTYAPGQQYLNTVISSDRETSLGALGLLYPPVIVSLTASNGAGSLANNGVYSYVVVYEFTDRAGNVYQSAPSVARSVTLGGTDDTVDLVVTTPYHPENVTVQIVVYRTLDGQNLHRWEEQLGTASAHTGTVTTITDTASDATISTNKLLYTDSGEAANRAPPCGRVYEVHKDRLWSIDPDTGDLLYSKVFEEGVAPSFADGFRVRTQQRPTAIKSLGNALAVFYRDAIGLVYGEGPNKKGAGGSFSQPQRIQGSTVGCDNPDSIVSTPQGVMFEDPDRWIHVLPAGGGVPQYIGADAEGNRQGQRTVIGAHVIDDKQEVRFITSDGTIVVYHYALGFWTENYLAAGGSNPLVSSAMWNGKHTLLLDDGTLMQEDVDASDFRDSYNIGEGSPTYVPVQIDTAWYKLDGFQGLVRVWDTWLLAEYRDDCTLTCTLNYDYETTGTDVFTFVVTEVYPLELRMRLRKQQIRAMYVSIRETQGAAASGYEGAWLHTLRLGFGVTKRRRGRTATAAQTQ